MATIGREKPKLERAGKTGKVLLHILMTRVIYMVAQLQFHIALNINIKRPCRVGRDAERKANGEKGCEAAHVLLLTRPLQAVLGEVICR